jgi:pimeloyl-ACP methyl ester carboxylesterase
MTTSRRTRSLDGIAAMSSVLFLWVLVACAAHPALARSLSRVSCPFEIGASPDPSRVSCSLLSVPENREAPATRSIRLLVVRIAAGTSSTRRADPVIYLTGGPGIHASFYVPLLMDHGVGRHRDIYILEQRGVGGTDFCPYWGREDRLSRPERTRADAFANEIIDMRACVRSARASGVDLSGYSTIESGRDVRELRETLGLERWNLWGISYGAMLAQAALKADPQGVRAIVLDGVVPLDMRGTALRGWWFKQLLARYRRACLEQPSCKSSFPEFEPMLLQAATELERQPMMVRGIAGAQGEDPLRSYRGDSVPLLPLLLSYERRYHPAVPAVIAGLAQMATTQDAERFRALASAPSLVDLESSPGLGAVLACRDGFHERSVSMIERDMALAPEWAVLLGSKAQLERHRHLCRELGLGQRDPREYALVQSNVPALIAAGAWDPVTPPPLAEAVLPGFSRAQYLLFPNSGHGATRTLPCAGDLLTGFLDHPLKRVHGGCAASGESPARFLGQLFSTRAAPRMLLLWKEQPGLAIAAVLLVGAALLWSAGIVLAVMVRWIVGRAPCDPMGVLGNGAALVSLVFAGGMAAAAVTTAETAQPLLLFGLIGWAWVPALLGPVLAGLGAGVLWTAFARGSGQPEVRIRSARAATGLAALVVSAAALILDLWPV